MARATVGISLIVSLVLFYAYSWHNVLTTESRVCEEAVVVDKYTALAGPKRTANERFFLEVKSDNFSDVSSVKHSTWDSAYKGKKLGWCFRNPDRFGGFYAITFFYVAGVTFVIVFSAVVAFFSWLFGSEEE